MTTEFRPESARRYRLLLDLARDVTAQRELAGVLEATFAALRSIVGFNGGSIALLDEDGYISLAATDPPATAEALTVRIPLGEGVAGRIALTGEPHYIPDITADPSVTPERRAKSVSSGVRSYFGVPLVAEGRPIGVLQIDATAVDAFTEEDRVAVLSFTPIVAAAVQNARLHAREAAAMARLRELDQRHRDFVALVSHELRTPLTAVIGFTETVLAHYDDLDRAAVLELVGRTGSAARRLAQMVEDLLDLSVIQRGEMHISPGPCDVRSVVADAVAQFVPERRRVDVAVEVPGRVVADGPRLVQVVGNLLSNAAKFSADDTTIRLRARLDGGVLVIEVTDQGTGIPAGDRGRIFERFVQLERATVRRSGGFGIGLYLVRSVCEAMGATVEVDSELGRGSTFRVRLPTTPA